MAPPLDNREAVTHGLAATGKTITAAAAIMVLVFARFVLGGQRIIEMFGIGLASAVLLDAVIVRSVVVPALMLLLGRPTGTSRGSERVLPHLRVEGQVRRDRRATAAPSEKRSQSRRPSELLVGRPDRPAPAPVAACQTGSSVTSRDTSAA